MTKARDEVTERLRALLAQLMAERGEMPQKELARRANQPVNRVHKFVNGDLPYPPLQFLVDVFAVFGLSLAEILAMATPPSARTTPPALRADVLDLAQLLESFDTTYVASLRALVEASARARSRRRTRAS